MNKRKRTVVCAYDDVEVGKRLRRLRQALNMKQTDLCRLTGITGQTWNNAETGDNLLTVPNAVKVCQVTGCTMDWIYRGQVIGLPAILLKEIQKRPRRGDVG